MSHLVPFIPLLTSSQFLMNSVALSALGLDKLTETVEKVVVDLDALRPPAYILHPSGSLRTSWNLLTVLALLWDVIVIPMEFFSLPQSTLLAVLSWFMICFWTLDIPCSFLTGIYSKGLLVMEPKAISRAYFKSWFLLDIILISFDWIVLPLQGGKEVGKDGFRSNMVKQIRRSMISREFLPLAV